MLVSILLDETGKAIPPRIWDHWISAVAFTSRRHVYASIERGLQAVFWGCGLSVRAAPQVRVEELANSAPGILGGRFVVLRAGDAGQETKQQGGIGRVVVVHEAVTDSRIDLHVVRHVVLAQQPAQTPSGTPTPG